MPYFVWRGVTLMGTMRKGKMVARSTTELDDALFKRDIALMHSKQIRLPLWFDRRISSALKINFFRQLAVLLSSGVYLAQALTMVSYNMSSSPRFQEIIITLADQVQRGVSLSVALAAYPTIFDQLMVQMVQIGSDTATLSETLTLLCDDLEMKQDIRARLRSAALLPLFTFLFFMSVAFFLVAVVVPRFSIIFTTYGAELPLATQTLITFSDLVRSWWMLVYMGFMGVCCMVLRAYACTARGRQFVEQVVLRVPRIGSIVRTYMVASSFRAVAILIERGTPLVTALHTVRTTVAHTVLMHQLIYLEQEVAAGTALSQAMLQLHKGVFDHELIAAIRVGEESGNLAVMLKRITNAYHEKVTREMQQLTALLQPLLMIVLGLMITLLIVAVYMPIFSLSQVVG